MAIISNEKKVIILTEILNSLGFKYADMELLMQVVYKMNKQGLGDSVDILKDAISKSIESNNLSVNGILSYLFDSIISTIHSKFPKINKDDLCPYIDGFKSYIAFKGNKSMNFEAEKMLRSFKVNS